MQKLLFKILFALLLFSVPAWAADPLPSWNNTAPKQAIIKLVKEVTNPHSPGFVPAADRIATFDNDGTLWAEQPVYFQYFYILDRLKALSPQHPEWQTQEPFASLLKGDLETALSGGNEAAATLMLATHTGFTPEQFKQSVQNWIAKARHPQSNRLFTEMVYQPMRELIAYLQANGFKTYIVSGGDIDFMRPWTQKAYSIPPEQVIGTSVKMKFELNNGVAQLVGAPEINFVSDVEGKPIGINQYIGKRPTAAFGNSDGDLPMMQWTASGKGPHLCLYVHHTDGVREWAYDRKSPVGRLDQGLDEALAKGWTIASMKDDWKVIFPAGQ